MPKLTQITTRDLRAMGVDSAGLAALRRYGHLEPVHNGANLYWATPALLFAAALCSTASTRERRPNGRKVSARYKRLLAG